MQGNAQGLVALGQLNTPGFGGDKLPCLLGNHGLTRVQVDGGLGLFHRRIYSFLQACRVDRDLHLEILLLTRLHRNAGRHREFNTGHIGASRIGNRVGVRLGIEILDRHLAGERLLTCVCRIFQHAESLRDLLRTVRVVQKHAGINSGLRINAPRTHAIHRVGMPVGIVQVMVCAVHHRRLDLNRRIILMRLQHLRRHTGGKGRRHRRTRVLNRARSGTHGGRGNIIPRRGEIGLRVPVRAVEPACARGCQLIKFTALNAQTTLEVFAQANL